MNEFHKKILNNNLLLSGAITYYFALITMVVMPIYHWYLPPFMIAWGVFSILEFRKRIPEIQKIDPKSKVLFILFMLFFVWQILGMLYSDNPKEGWRNIILRLSLFLFPLVLISPGNKIRRTIPLLLRIFALSTFFYTLICLGYALLRSFILQNGIWIFNPHPPDYPWLNYFFGAELAIFQHPSYLSVYILFSAFIAVESFFDKSIKQKWRTSWLAISIILTISIYLLSSRAEILATIITVPLYFAYKFKDLGKKRNIVLFLIACLFIVIPVSISNPRLKYYFNSGSKKELPDKILKESRVVIWKAASNIIRQNVVFGVGTGNIQIELNEEYIRAGDKSLMIENNLNAHNQFLEILLENGLIGLLIFLSVIGIMFHIAISENNLLYTIFLIIVLISFLFETMLNRLAGVAFFSLFSFLLLHIPKNRTLD